MADISPVIPAGRQVIETYGEMRFHISGVRYTGPVIVLPDRVLPWAPTTCRRSSWTPGVRLRATGTNTGGTYSTPLRTLGDSAGVDFASFDALCQDNLADVLLLGCGPRAVLPPRALRDALRAKGLVVEPMDTGAACRTYNVLMAEDRRVAAALIPVA